MLNCIAIDDEPLALQLLVDNISKVPFLHLTAGCDNALEAINLLCVNKVDLIFIDIQMPGLTGLQFIESLPVKPMFVIITAYKQYALEGFSLDVIDYLLKPVTFDRFLKACNKARELHYLKEKSSGHLNSPGYMFVNVGYSMAKVLFNEIIFIEGLKDYVQIHLNNSSKTLVVRMGVKAMLEQLPQNEFIQIHKSFIISLNHISAVRKNSLFIGEKEFFIGDSYKENVRKIISGGENKT